MKSLTIPKGLSALSNICWSLLTVVCLRNYISYFSVLNDLSQNIDLCEKKEDKREL